MIIFTNGTSGVPAILIRGTLAAISTRADFELAAVCLPERQSQVKLLCSNLLDRTLFGLRSLTEPATRRRHRLPWPINLNRCSRKHHFKALFPPGGNINDPVFIARLRDEIKPTIAISFFCLKKFSPALLGIFSYTINYHNGLLPAYGGLRATAWSLYQEERETGFTFHCMTEALDEGNILLQERVPVGTGWKALDLELEKAVRAATCIPTVFRMAFDGDHGRPQRGAKSYYSRKDGLAVTVIAEPSSLSRMELMKRLKAFGNLRIKISDRWHEVTGIEEVSDGFHKKGGRTFRTSDGVLMRAVRFRHLPFALYQVYGWLKKLFSRKAPVRFS